MFAKLLFGLVVVIAMVVIWLAPSAVIVLAFRAILLLAAFYAVMTI